MGLTSRFLTRRNLTRSTEPLSLTSPGHSDCRVYRSGFPVVNAPQTPAEVTASGTAFSGQAVVAVPVATPQSVEVRCTGVGATLGSTGLLIASQLGDVVP